MIQSGTTALRLVFALITATSLLAACTAASGTSPSAAATSASGTPTASPTPAGGGGASASAAATPTASNPCNLLTAQQVMQVNGISYGAGVLHQLSSGAQCTWLTDSPHASVVLQVVVAPSVTIAQQAYAETQAGLTSAFSITQVPNLADAAVIARAPAGTVNTGGIYVLHGNTFFDVVYLNGTTPSDNQLKLTATLILGELP